MEDKFEMGKVVVTQQAMLVLEKATISVQGLLQRHGRGDWGDLSADEWEANGYGLCEGYRLFSSYELLTDEKVWVITEWDRSVTTVLTPSEWSINDDINRL